MATKIVYTQKNGQAASMVVGSRAVAEQLAKSLKNAELSEVAVNAPVVHPKPVKGGSVSDQQKSANRFYKGQRQPVVDVQLHLEAAPTAESEAAFLASCVSDGIPEWQAQKALREGKRELKNRKSA